MGQGSIDKQSNANNKPKRPMTAYNVFFKQQRQAILLQTGGHSGGFATLARTIATRWKSIGPEERAVCIRKAAEDKTRYQEEMKLWLEDKMVEICTIDPAASYEHSPRPVRAANGKSVSSGKGEGEATPEALVSRHSLFNTLRNTPCTMNQNVSLELRRLDFIELALMGLNASVEKQRRRNQKETPKMDKRRNQTQLNLPYKRRKIDSCATKNLRSVFEVEAQLDTEHPSLEYCSMQLELDDEICFSEY